MTFDISNLADLTIKAIRDSFETAGEPAHPLAHKFALAQAQALRKDSLQEMFVDPGMFQELAGELPSFEPVPGLTDSFSPQSVTGPESLQNYEAARQLEAAWYASDGELDIVDMMNIDPDDMAFLGGQFAEVAPLMRQAQRYQEAHLLSEQGKNEWLRSLVNDRVKPGEEVSELTGVLEVDREMLEDLTTLDGGPLPLEELWYSAEIGTFGMGALRPETIAALQTTARRRAWETNPAYWEKGGVKTKIENPNYAEDGERLKAGTVDPDIEENLMLGGAPAFTDDQLKIRNEFRAEAINQEMLMVQAMQRGMLPSDAISTTVSLGEQDNIINSTFGALLGVGTAMVDGAVTLANHTWFLPGSHSIAAGPIAALFAVRKRQNNERMDALIEARANLDMDALTQKAAQDTIFEAWNYTKQHEPEIFEEYMLMAGGQEAMAFGLFGIEVENAPTVKAQTEALIDSRVKSQDEMVRQLSDRDFRLSHDVMDILSAWGHEVGRLGTITSLIFKDSDYLLAAANLDFSPIINAAEKYDNQPSKVLGLDGTMLGLSYDLLIGAVLDPTTWLFGPKYSGTNGIRSAADVSRTMRSGWWQSFRRDVVNIAADPSKGVGSFVNANAWVTDIGLLTEILEATGFVPSHLVKSNGAFKAVDELGDAARTVRWTRTSTVRGLVDDLPASSPEALARARAHLETAGHNKPIVIRMTKDGRIYGPESTRVTALIRAADDLGHSAVPTTIKIVDDIDPRAAGRVGPKAADEARLRDLSRQIDDRQKQVMEAREVPGEPLVDDAAAQALGFDDAADAGRVWDADWKEFSRRAGYSEKDISMFDEFMQAAERVGDDAQAITHDARQATPPRTADRDFAGRSVRNGDDAYLNPENVFDGNALYGEIDLARLDAAYTKALLLGMEPGRGIHSLRATLRASRLREAIGSGSRSHITKWINQMNQTRLVTTAGPTAMDSIVDAVYTVAGHLDDGHVAASTLERVVQAHRATRAAADDITTAAVAVRTLNDEAIALRASIGSDVLPAGVESTVASRAARSRLSDLEMEIKNIKIQMMRLKIEADPSVAIHQALDDLWDEVARRDIFNGERFRKIGPEERVPWDELEKGLRVENPQIAKDASDAAKYREAVGEPDRPFLTDDVGVILGDTLDALGITAKEADKMAQYLLGPQGKTAQWTAPIAPWKIVAATTASGAMFTQKLKSSVTANVIRNGFRTLHLTWVLDKIATVPTAFAVSMDELLRMWHEVGISGKMSWLGSKFENIKARKGIGKMRSPAPELPLDRAAIERAAADASMDGWTSIEIGNPHHRPAGQNFSQNFINDRGFQAAMTMDKADFVAWLDSDEALRLNYTPVFDVAEGGLLYGITQPELLWEGYQFLWKFISRNVDAGDAVRFRGEFIHAIEGAKTGVRTNLSDWAVDRLGTVKGISPTDAPGTYTSGTNAVMAKLMQDGTQVRRSEVAKNISKFERQRLVELYDSQGLQIVPDSAMVQWIEQGGVPGAAVYSQYYQPLLWEKALENGMVPESYIQHVVDKRVSAEIEHLLYNWDKASLIGPRSTAVVPFGGPWADMFGFWGRELFSRPQVRERFFRNRVTAPAGQALSALPVNPRPAALWSRIAATDMEMDIGSAEVDFGRLLFMPTMGDDPFYVLLPGIGYLPLIMVDFILDRVDDEDESIRGVLESFAPMFRGDRGIGQRFIGGGNLNRVASIGDNIADYNQGYHGDESFGRLFGDVTAAIRQHEAVAQHISTPEFWDHFYDMVGEAESVDELTTEFNKVIVNEIRSAAQGNIVNAAARILAPVGVKTDYAYGERPDVWLRTHLEYPALLTPDSLVGQDIQTILNTGTDEQKARIASEIRKHYFGLPTLVTLAISAAYPAINASRVSRWTWSEGARQNPALTDETSSAYDIGVANKAGLDAHSERVKEGIIVPQDPQRWARITVGTHLAARNGLASQIWEEVAVQANDKQWQEMWDHYQLYGQAGSRQVVQLMNGILALMEDPQFADLELADQGPQAVWKNWGTLGDEYWDYLVTNHAQNIGIFEDLDEYLEAGLKPSLPGGGELYRKLPSGISPFDETLKFDPDATAGAFYSVDNPSSRVREMEILNFLSPELLEAAEIAGIDMEGVVSGRDLNRVLVDYKSDPKYARLAKTFSANDYESYIDDRSDSTTQRNVLREQTKHIPYNLRQDVDHFLMWADYQREKYRDVVGDIALGTQEEAVERWNELVMRMPPTMQASTDKWWDAIFAEDFGPQDWIPPDPPGDPVAAGGFQPYIRQIVDGDTIAVSPDSGLFFLGSEFDETTPSSYKVRLLGVRAADYSNDPDGALVDEEFLRDAIMQARDQNLPIYLVPDERFGNVDAYGRRFAWLYLGNEPFYFPEDFRRHQDPSGGE